MKFFSTVPYSPPDEELYVGLKHIRPIRCQPADELAPLSEGVRIPSVVLELFGTEMALAWMTFAHHRLQAAALGSRNRQQLPTAFPGRLLPGPKGGVPVDRGCLQIDWLRRVHELEQPEQVDPILDRLGRSSLRVLRFFDATTRQGVWEAETLREMVRDRGFLHDRDQTSAMAWVDALWSPGQKLPTVPRVFLELMDALVQPFRRQRPDELALIIEAHDLVRRLSAFSSLTLKPVGIGVLNGVWYEIGLMNPMTIKATELVQTARVVQELTTIYTRGFAPVAVNEWGCNVDGSHRQVATIIWNALCAGRKRRGDLDLDDTVRDFVNRRLDEMGQLLTHEVERVFSEALYDQRLRVALEAAYAVAHPSRVVEHLPVVFVPEWSAGTVIKRLYDDEGRSVRVCPSTYQLLYAQRDVVLPSRGPYHLTDAELSPWFTIVPDRE